MSTVSAKIQLCSDRDVLFIHMTQRVGICNCRHGCRHGSCLVHLIHCTNSVITILWQSVQSCRKQHTCGRISISPCSLTHGFFLSPCPCFCLCLWAVPCPYHSLLCQPHTNTLPTREFHQSRISRLWQKTMEIFQYFARTRSSEQSFFYLFFHLFLFLFFIFLAFSCFQFVLLCSFFFFFSVPCFFLFSLLFV